MNQGGFLLTSIFHVRKHVYFTRVYKIEATYEVSRVDIKVERGAVFTFTRDLSYIASILFTHVNFTRECAKKLRDIGNPPSRSKCTFTRDLLYLRA